MRCGVRGCIYCFGWCGVGRFLGGALFCGDESGVVGGLGGGFLGAGVEVVGWRRAWVWRRGRMTLWDDVLDDVHLLGSLRREKAL